MGLVTLDCRNSTLIAINNQRHDGVLCDVKLKLDHGEVLAHKAVLAACSPYFNTMFTGGFKEGDSSVTEVNMSEVFPDYMTAEDIIESMYTGQLDVTTDNVCTLYGVCSFILYDGPVHICEDLMASHLTLDSCLEYWRATHHNLSGRVHSSAAELLKNRFHDHFIHQDCLLDTPLNTLSNLLNSKITQFCNSKQIMKFLLNWFVKSGLSEANVMKRLVTEANLPVKLSSQDILGGIRYGLTMRGMSSRVIRNVCMEVQDAILPATVAAGDSLPAPVTEPMYDWTMDSHLPSSVLKRETLDVILAVTPRFTGIRNNKNDYGELRFCTYDPQSRLWVDVGTADYPKHNNGAAVSVSQSRVYGVGGNVYLLSDNGSEVFFLPIPSFQWTKVALPRRHYAERQVFLLPLESTMFSIIIYRIIQHVSPSSCGQAVHTLILGKITDEGIWEDILQHEPDGEARMANALYGPCWVERSCFLVHCSPRDSLGHCANVGNILMLNPGTKDIAFASYAVDMDHPSLRSTLRSRPLLLEHGGWTYGWDPPSAYDPASEVRKFRMSDDKSHVLLETQTKSFPDLISSSIQTTSASIRSVLTLEKPSHHVYTTVSSSLWHFSGIEQANSSLHELRIVEPNVWNEHTPPPCNVILAATTVSLNSAFLSKQPQARYHQIHD